MGSRAKHLHVEHDCIEDFLSGYIRCDSKRGCRSQDVVEPREPFASVVDRVQERSEDALHDEEHKHSENKQDLTSDGNVVS